MHVKKKKNVCREQQPVCCNISVSVEKQDWFILKNKWFNVLSEPEVIEGPMNDFPISFINKCAQSLLESIRSVAFKVT